MNWDWIKCVAVALIVHGQSVDTIDTNADGSWQKINFSYTIPRSAWIALRIARAEVDQCWKMKEGNFRPEERKAAATDYEKARKIYDDIILKAHAIN